MDVPCPKSNSTDLQKVSLACEEVLNPCDKPAHLHGVLVESRGPGVLVGTSTTNGTRQMKLTAQSGGMATRRIYRKTSAQLLSFEIFVVQLSSPLPLLKVCWPHASKIARHVELFGPNHEIE
jgi:hypothetical protein